MKRILPQFSNEVDEIDQHLISYHHFIQYLPDMAFCKNRNMEFVAANQNFVTFSGHKSIENLRFKNDYDMRWKKLAEKYRCDDQRVLAGETLDFIEHNIDMNGQLAVIYVQKKPVKLIDKVIGIFCYARQLTQVQNASKTALLNGASTQYLVFSAQQIAECFFNLTITEAETLYFFIRGHSARAIGQFLKRNPRTIEDRLAKIKDKLGCQFKHEVIHKAIASGFMCITPTTLLAKEIDFISGSTPSR